RAFRRALQDRSVALRIAQGAGREDRLVRRTWSAGHDANHARRRLHANRCRVEQGRLRQLAARAGRVGAGAARALLLPCRQGRWFYCCRAGAASVAFFSSPWIVAPQKPAAPVAVLASNITWNAYNNFGGRSNYIHADHLPAAPTVNARMELSRYNDPEFGTWN